MRDDIKEAVKAIKSALKKRSGKNWSVTVARGSSYGWITIDSLPSNLVEGITPESDRRMLEKLLDLDCVGFQGILIPSSSAHRREYINRAEGKPYIVAERYWN